MTSPAENSDVSTHFRTCPLCEATCGLEITTKGDQVVRIRGDRDDVFSKGFICPKGSSLKQLHEDPDRLRVPMIRRGDDWVEVSWDEAFAEIHERLLPLLDDVGRDSLAMVLGNPNTHNGVGTYYLRPVIHAAGTKNVYSASTVDQMPKHLTSGLMWGNANAFPLPDLDRTDYLFMLGANPVASNGSLCTAPDFPGRIEAIKERGGKVVLIDPRRTETAEIASEHHFIRPGSDLHLLLAIVKELFDNDLVDMGRVGEFVNGVDTVRDLVAGVSVDEAAVATGIDSDTIGRLAAEIAAAPTAVVYGRMGNHTVEFGTLTSWAADVINVLTGNLDSAGGAMFASPATIRIADETPGGRGYSTGRWSSRVGGRHEVNGEFPAAGLAEEIETPGDGQIRALVNIACNPIRSFPNSERLDAAFAGLDFMVAVDLYLNETTRHADVILPPLNPLERPHYDFAFEGNAVRVVTNFSEAVFPASGPDEAEILARLALVLGGFGPDADPELVHDQLVDGVLDRELKSEHSPIFGRDKDEIVAELKKLPPVERIIDLRLRTGRFGDGFGANPGGLSIGQLKENPHGMDFGPLVERLPGALKTKSGMVELAPQLIVDDMARFEASRSSSNDRELLLIGRRHVRSNNSWMHNITTLVKGRSRTALFMHPDDAAAREIADGGLVEVASAVGKVETAVQLTDDLMPGVVCLPHGWGHQVEGTRMQIAREQVGANLNELIDDAIIDVPSGNGVLNGVPVSVAPVA